MRLVALGRQAIPRAAYQRGQNPPLRESRVWKDARTSLRLGTQCIVWPLEKTIGTRIKIRKDFVENFAGVVKVAQYICGGNDTFNTPRLMSPLVGAP